MKSSRRWAMSRGQHEKTVDYLLAALTAFKTPGGEPMGDLERNVRQQLVQTYEVLKHRKNATEHLLALGANQDWFPTTEPVFRAAADLPAELIEKQIDGKVTVSFTVDEARFQRQLKQSFKACSTESFIV